MTNLRQHLRGVAVSNMTVPRVTEDDIHHRHARFVLALHMSCRGILPTCDHNWLPVTVSATSKMSSEIQLQHMSGWYVTKMLTTFPTKSLKNHTHKNQTLNSTKGTLKSIDYFLSLHITEHFKNYCGPGNKLTLNISGRESREQTSFESNFIPWNKKNNKKQCLKHSIIISNRSIL